MEAWTIPSTRRNAGVEEWRNETCERRNKMHRWTSETTPNGTKQDASANSVPKAVESPLVRIQKALFCSPVKRCTNNHERKPLAHVQRKQHPPEEEEEEEARIVLRARSLPEPQAFERCKEHIDQIVEQALERTKRRSSQSPAFKEHLLPIVDDCHYGPSRISAETLADVITQPERWEVCEYLIVDCRYPYEFDGGHVKGAINLFEPADVEHAFLSEDRKINRNTVVVFHCEFSSQRAPKMYGHIRNLDRKMNLKNYPKLDFPHMYIMDGGYKDFFSKFEDLCEGGYTMMCDPDHGEELKVCHTRYKSLWQDRGMSHRGSY